MNNNFTDIPEFEGLYEINTDGVVRNKKTGKYPKIGVNRSKYLCVFLTKQKKLYGKLIHRLLALTYLPTVEGKNIVNHKDGNKLNNALANLEWCTTKENSRHAFRTGLMVNQIKRAREDGLGKFGSKNKHFKYSFELIQLVRKLKSEGKTSKEISQITSMNPNSVASYCVPSCTKRKIA